MGQSTNGMIFYGYMWEEESEDLDITIDMDDLATAVLKAQGHTDPWDSHPGGRAPEWMAANDAAIDAWSDLQQAWVNAQAVDWGRHCSGEYPMPYLYIKGTGMTAYRGSPRPIAPSLLVAGEDWKQQLDAFLASQDITPPEGENQPGWWLASYWG